MSNLSSRRFRCPRHPDGATYRVANGRRGGKPQTKRRCAVCHRARGPQGLSERGECVRCGSKDIGTARTKDGREYARCRECQRRWAREARRRDPQASRTRSAQYAASAGFYEPTTLALDEDPWFVNAERLEKALGRPLRSPGAMPVAPPMGDPWDVLLAPPAGACVREGSR